MNDILSWIEVGKLSAERDDRLSEYFFDNGVLSSVINSPSSFLVLGRKGAGKTALFRHLTTNPSLFLKQDEILVPLSFEDYNWSVHSLLKNELAAESLSYKQSWRFVILIEVIKAYFRHLKEKNINIPKELSKAQEVINKIFNEPLPSISNIIGKKLLSLGKISLPKAGVGFNDDGFESLDLDGGEISFETIKNDEDLKEKLRTNIDYFITYFETVIQSISPMKAKIFICFDRIDEAWDNISVEVSRKVIAGLVTAADSMTPKYKGFIRPIIFLREDIFEVLSINDSNKLREDCGALLHWDKESLVKLLLKRINYYAQQKGIPLINNIDIIFNKDEMRQRLKPINYIIKRSMMRPRDLISLMDKTIRSMKDAKNDPFEESIETSDKLDVDFIYQAEPKYSEWLRQEIIDEWSVQRPEIISLLAAIQNNSLTNFTKERIITEMKKIDDNYNEEKINSQLRFLFEISLIGFKIGQSTIWKYKSFYPAQGFIDSDEYKIHDGLTRALNLKEPRDKGDQV
ncbi:P-loop ATPase, Sll1717 family [Erwinia sp. LJJL01]|uniref:P-loop ATPase, Sll1717 family n=1 Tax=Erwinia sp. LJJL01 TaxID=3391839 RepID=UPI00105B91D4